MFGLDTFLLGAIAGGAAIFLCPGLGTGGNAIYKRVREWFRELGTRF